MGVMACHKRNCENIMCDRISDLYGYICYDCFEELVGLGAETNISDFMRTVKRPHNEEAARARFGIEFPIIE